MKHSLVLKTAGSNRFCGKEKKKRKIDKKKDEKDWLRMRFDWPFLIQVAICTGPQNTEL